MLPIKIKKFFHWVRVVLMIFLGLFLMVFGEFDDSPGAQGIGLIMIIATVVKVIRDRKKDIKSSSL